MKMKDIQDKQAKAFVANHKVICSGHGRTLFKGEVIQCNAKHPTPQRETRRFTKAEKKLIRKMARNAAFAVQRSR